MLITTCPKKIEAKQPLRKHSPHEYKKYTMTNCHLQVNVANNTVYVLHTRKYLLPYPTQQLIILILISLGSW